ncbi:MAG TPA: HU family DNA-binding protein [Candidatus Marinimicrobia bacterium]|nr:HU family DNA-binding protein [Candidatus Neomarinimicrobiota bacterium]HRS51867.1 HU family DNA-binding protein [Candidatus Neomarinimicrobiota bacterium]HRU92672.1 HU family DNA-binding protein [Candidatus Neomarinimicrobiota bacterium]
MKVKTYTKKDVVRRTAEALDTKLVDTAEIVDGVFMVLREMLSEPDPKIRIEIRNFGVFEVKPTKAKPKARNPRTNEEVYVPARRKTHFKPGRLLKERMKKA